MGKPETIVRFRVRYSETDQMGTFYNSRALEWFELGRAELLRQIGLPYAEMEDEGVFLPLVEAHVEYKGRARFDDELSMTVAAKMNGKASVRFDINIVHLGSQKPVTCGYTIHAVTDRLGKAVRPPAKLVEALNRQGSGE